MKFTSEGGLRSHTSYHAEENLKHKCRECGKVFGWDRTTKQTTPLTNLKT
jgi:hypothetical protein